MSMIAVYGIGGSLLISHGHPWVYMFLVLGVCGILANKLLDWHLGRTIRRLRAEENKRKHMSFWLDVLKGQGMGSKAPMYEDVHTGDRFRLPVETLIENFNEFRREAMSIRMNGV